MIHLTTSHPSGIIEDAYVDLHAQNLLCPICFKEIDLDGEDLQSWVWGVTVNLTEKSAIRLPCNCDVLLGKFCENAIEIDELISLPISLLNQAGYYTKASCSGHTLNSMGGYVMFADIYEPVVDYIIKNSMLDILTLEKTTVQEDVVRYLHYINGEWTTKSISMLSKEYPQTPHLVIRAKSRDSKSGFALMLEFREALLKIATGLAK